jgi:hypothetical protein
MVRAFRFVALLSAVVAGGCARSQQSSTAPSPTPVATARVSAPVPARPTPAPAAPPTPAFATAAPQAPPLPRAVVSPPPPPAATPVRGLPSAAPHAAPVSHAAAAIPQILSVSLSPTVVRSGTTVHAVVRTTPQIVAVRAIVGTAGDQAIAVPRVGAGDFEGTAVVPQLPPFLHGTFPVTFVAVTGGGRSTQAAVSVQVP